MELNQHPQQTLSESVSGFRIGSKTSSSTSTESESRNQEHQIIQDEKWLASDVNTKNEDDSSYDSDGSDSFSQKPQKHDDVSRTSSDTLSAEYSEYVTHNNDEHLSKIEFGLKLGYSEDVIHTALEKLHPNPGQNELLAELIYLSKYSNVTNPVQQQQQRLLNPVSVTDDSLKSKLRHIVIDGSNVAMSHGNKEIFSCRGIKLCVDWFRARGHQEITVFVPKWRKEAPRLDNAISDQDILSELEHDRLLVFTPSRLVGGKRLVCYDDRYILRLAADNDGIVVSNDNYRDLVQESPEFRKVVEKRILMYSFVNDKFMPPDDPLGRSGPNLDTFLSFSPLRTSHALSLCPYGKKCTYGNKCKFHHPERTLQPHRPITERLMTQSTQSGYQSLKLNAKSLSVPLNSTPTRPKASLVLSKSNILPTSSNNLHKKLQRQLTLNPNNDPRLYQLYPTSTISGSGSGSAWHNPQQPNWHPQQQFQEARQKLQYHLSALFPEVQVLQVMQMYPEETNAQKLCAAILMAFPPKM